MNKFERDVYYSLIGKPHLEPIFTSVYGIPERAREVDPDIFIVRNTKRKVFEIHSLGNKGDTFCFVVPHKELDARTIALVRKGNLKTRGKAIFREMDEHNERLERSNERQRDNEINAIAREMKPYFAKYAWENV